MSDNSYIHHLTIQTVIAHMDAFSNHAIAIWLLTCQHSKHSLLCLKVLPVTTTELMVPAVSASQTLSAYTVDTFTDTIQAQVCHMPVDCPFASPANAHMGRRLGCTYG